MNPVQAKAMADAFLDGIQREFAITRKVIAAIPEDQKGFKLGEKGRTAAEIAWHIVLTEAWFAESLIAGSFGAESPAPADATIAEMVDWYDKNVPGLTEKVKALSGEDFARKLDFFNVYNLPAFAYLNFWMVHRPPRLSGRLPPGHERACTFDLRRQRGRTVRDAGYRISRRTTPMRFTCQPGCTNCCTQKGFVYLTEQDIVRAAAFLGMRPRVFEKRYVYRTRNQRRLRMTAGSGCPFLVEGGCSIHAANPTQCRIFPFWPELVDHKREWLKTARYCPGIGKGELIQIDAARKQADEMRAAYPHMYDRS
jgi:Fe-S-cluster containining protein